jgi:dTDP-4-dehydrorhamnose reductase
MDGDIQKAKTATTENYVAARSAGKHYVIGAGNLGMSLYKRLIETGCEAELLSKSTGYNILDVERNDSFYTDPSSTIWYCLGYGSVEQAKENPEQAMFFHFDQPYQLLFQARGSLIFFSSDYAADEYRPDDSLRNSPNPRSAYARLKIMLEMSVIALARPRTTIIRVGSLYGTHKPLNTFPARIIANRQEVEAKGLTANFVTPTPTDWLADKLVWNFKKIISDDGPTIHHCAPAGGVTIAEWGSLVLGKNVKGPRYDNERPMYSSLGCSFADFSHYSWRDLWSEFGKDLLERL